MDYIGFYFFTDLALAFLFGGLSFLSPCVLPIVPSYLAYMTGVSVADLDQNKDKRRETVKTAISFTLGLSVVFLLLALSVNRLGTVFLAYQDWIYRVAGIVIVIFGLQFLGIFQFSFLMKRAELDFKPKKKNIGGAFILGLTFAFGWTPCLGPMLSTILTMIAVEQSLAQGLALMVAYALGLGLPFILVALLFDRYVRYSGFLKNHMHTIEKVMGGLLVVVGLLMFFGSFTILANWLIQVMPFLLKIG